MKDYKQLEELISLTIKTYQERYNAVGDYEAEFNLTLTNHKVEVEKVSKWVAYLRLERRVRPKGGTDQEWEALLIYNQAYKFLNTQERLNADAPWKYDLYMDLLTKLVAGGLEYGELLKRLQNMTKDKPAQPIANLVAPPQEEKIMVTNKMPEPLREDEKEYVEWIKKHGQKDKSL